MLTGQADLGWGDLLAMALPRFIRAMAMFAVAALVVVAGGWAFSLSPRLWTRMFEQPGWAVGAFWSDTWPVLLGMCGSFAVIIAFLSVLRWARLPRDNRSIRYEVNATSLTLLDRSGFRHQIPWSGVRRVYRSQGLLALQLKVRMLRYVPLRAFDGPGQERLWRMIAEAGVPVRR